jgi:hypothetical protein
METDKKTCAQLVYQKMMERNEQLDEIETIISDIESTEEMISEAVEELHTLALGHEVRRTIKIHLSTGGPADWIEVILDLDDDYIYGMNYHYADWFDHAETTIEKNSYLWDYAANFIDRI